MTDDEILQALKDLLPIAMNVIGFDDLAEHLANDSLDQLKANARAYADGHVLARRIFSLSQRVDETAACLELVDGLRLLRPLCTEIIGANAWVDDETAPEVDRLMSQAQAYADGFELAIRITMLIGELEDDE